MAYYNKPPDKEYIRRQIEDILEEKFDSTPETRIRRQIEKRIQQRKGLYTHLVIYCGVIIFLWLIWAFTDQGFPWPIFPMGGWGIGILAHIVSYYNDNSDKQERIINQMVRDELKRQSYQESDYDSLFDDHFR